MMFSFDVALDFYGACRLDKDTIILTYPENAGGVAREQGQAGSSNTGYFRVME